MGTGVGIRSIRNRLAFLFFIIFLAAIGAVYLYVVPQLQSRLRAERLSALATSARTYSAPIQATVGSDVPAPRVTKIVRQAADAAAARVTLLRLARAGAEVQTSLVADSSASVGPGPPRLKAADIAARTGRPATAVQSLPEGGTGQAARPLYLDGRVAEVVVYSSPLSDVQRTVAVVRRQVAIAGGVALLFAVLAGYLVARALAQRIKRLERGAERIAGGDFSDPMPVESEDELGQLTIAFNDMQRQLAQLESARKQFIATASHELRTPIFSLGGFVELLEDEELDAETRQRFLGQVAEQVARLRKLSVDLLDLSRLEAGSLELRPEHIDLADLARSVADEFEPTLAQHDSNLELRLTPRPVEAVCDPVRVAQVVRILIDNALTHTPTGTDISVTAVREDGAVRVAVRDRGAGIRREELARIFEPFYTSDDARGSGLGLAIASELAERMAGRLGVESTSGHTVFTLEIPA